MSKPFASIGLAGAGTGNHQKRTAGVTIQFGDAMLDGTTLFLIAAKNPDKPALPCNPATKAPAGHVAKVEKAQSTPTLRPTQLGLGEKAREETIERFAWKAQRYRPLCRLDDDRADAIAHNEPRRF
jgi:hypothetical protein